MPILEGRAKGSSKNFQCFHFHPYFFCCFSDDSFFVKAVLRDVTLTLEIGCFCILRINAIILYIVVLSCCELYDYNFHGTVDVLFSLR